MTKKAKVTPETADMFGDAGQAETKKDRQLFSLYLPLKTHERLRRAAFDNRTSMNQLAMDAIERMLDHWDAPKAKKGKK